MSNLPHYLLFAEASRNRNVAPTWRFVLQNIDTRQRLCASDREPIECRERLELLAVVRGLEALEGPARVTLVTKSRYVSRGIKTGLSDWRANNWRWERFGRVVLVRDHDLWQRVDRALGFHDVACQEWHFSDMEVETINEFEAAGEAVAFTAESSSAPIVRQSRPAAVQQGQAVGNRELLPRLRETWQTVIRSNRHALGATA